MRCAPPSGTPRSTTPVRSLATLELGRADLLLGRPADRAGTLLAFAETHPADPVSRHAIDAAPVAAARGTGDARAPRPGPAPRPPSRASPTTRTTPRGASSSRR
jgi:hypothetical protein